MFAGEIPAAKRGWAELSGPRVKNVGIRSDTGSSFNDVRGLAWRVLSWIVNLRQDAPAVAMPESSAGVLRFWPRIWLNPSGQVGRAGRELEMPGSFVATDFSDRLDMLTMPAIGIALFHEWSC